MTAPSDAFLLLARIFLSAPFLYSGVDKLGHVPAALAEFSALGVPFPAAALLLTILVQIGGGLMVLLGLYTRVGAVLLGGFTIVATLIAHRFWSLEGAEFTRQLTTALEHLAIVGGFIALLAAGQGALAMSRPTPAGPPSI